MAHAALLRLRVLQRLPAGGFVAVGVALLGHAGASGRAGREQEERGEEERCGERGGPSHLWGCAARWVTQAAASVPAGLDALG